MTNNEARRTKETLASRGCDFFGFLGQTIGALCTLSAILLVWTGFALAWHRFFKKFTAQ